MAKLFSRMFSSLKYRNFRLLAFGHFISLTGSWAQGIAMSWVAYEITQSPATLGIMMALSFAPLLLFGFIGGYWVDKLPKFKIIFTTSIVLSITPLVVAYYIFIGQININLLYFIALVTGLIRIIDTPARHAFRYSLIPESETKNAISILSTSNGFARVAGPLFAGILLSMLGAAWCFFVNGLSYLFVVVMLLMMRHEEFHIKESKKDFNTEKLLNSLRNVWKNKAVMETLILSAILSIFFLNTNVVFPVFTKEVFGLGVMSFASLVGIYSLGSIMGGLYSAQDRVISRSKVVNRSYISAAVFLMLSLPISYNFFLVLIFVSGFVLAELLNNLNSLIISNTENKSLGLINSLWMMAAVGTAAIGGPLVGFVSEYYSVQVFTFLAGSAFLAITFFWYRKG